MMTTKSRKQVVQEGASAFEAGYPSTDCPYHASNQQESFWQHGWWKAFYVQRDLDTKRISQWLNDFGPIELGLDEARAEAIAQIITMQGNFNRNEPITDNRIAGIEFTIPVPADLPDAK